MKLKIFALLVIIGLTACSKEKRSNKAGLKMQDFVVDISNYARSKKANFIIIPQNGIELFFKDLDTETDLDENYKNAVSGVGIEELFYNGGAVTPDERFNSIKTVRAAKPIFVSEFIDNISNLSNAFAVNQKELFVPFVRTPDNYDYSKIPDTIINESSLYIELLGDAKNYLYLISSDNYSNKNDYLNAIRATNYDLVIIDLFFGDAALTATEVQSLKIKANGAKRLVVSYISIGSAEKYRYYFEDDWKEGKPNFLKKKYEGYEDEFWVKFWKDDWRDIIFGNDESYMKKILDADFDGAYLDNVEAYYFLYYND